MFGQHTFTTCELTVWIHRVKCSGYGWHELFSRYLSFLGSILLSVNGGVVSKEWKSLRTQKVELSLYLPQGKHNCTCLLNGVRGEKYVASCVLPVTMQQLPSPSLIVLGRNLKGAEWYSAPKLQNCQLIFQGLITVSCNYQPAVYTPSRGSATKESAH